MIIGSELPTQPKMTSTGDRAMSNYEMQIQATGQHYDQEMRNIERQGGEILSSVVPGSNLHQKIHNPVTEGIDEG